MSRSQTIFLRAFRTDPFGPGVEKWPSPAILRRWLRRPGFVQAMRSIRDAMRYQADFQLLAASASAAHAMHTSVSASDRELQTAQLNAMSSLMKLAHLRQRFAPADPPPPLRISALEELVCTAHPNAPVHALLDMHQSYTGRDLRADYRARVEAEKAAGVKRQFLIERPIGRLRGDEDDDNDDDHDNDDQHDTDEQETGEESAAR